MTDIAPTVPAPASHDSEGRFSVPAIVTYWLLGIWTAIIVMVFQLVHDGIKIDGILLALVSGLIGTQTTLLVASVSFWVGATVGGKAANERLSKASEMSSAALERIASGASPLTDLGSPPPGTANLSAAADVDITVRKAEEPNKG